MGVAENKESIEKVEPVDEENKEPVQTSEDKNETIDSVPVAELEDTGDTDTLEVTPEASEEHSAVVPSLKKTNRFKRFLKTKKGKVITIITAVIIVLGVLYAIPTTRYGILGMFVKKNVTISINDGTTHKPITQAIVALGEVTAKTDNNGKVILHTVPVGEYSLKVTKKYYKDVESQYTVPVFGNPESTNLNLVATGRQVSVVIKNKITQAFLAKATIAVQDTSSITDEKGVATVVLPADKKTLKGTVKLDGYNQSDIDIKVTEQADANVFTVTPAGTIYYLSKQTGKINVMKSNLDGSDASVVVEGTGNESDTATLLLASRDWKYLALSAKRTNDTTNQLYFIDAKSGKMTTIDQGNADFELAGWSDHRFVYKVTRNDKKDWEDKRQALKSYDAETGKLATIDETSGMGTDYNTMQAESINDPYILDGKVIYNKRWSIGGFIPLPTDKKSAIMVINPDGSQKQRVKEFSMQRYMSIESKLYEPRALYFRVSIDDGAGTFYEYEANAIKTVSNTDDKFRNTFYATYLLSPSSEKTLWYEPRDGKNALFVGDKDAKNTLQIGSQSEYIAYGWYSDAYVLLSKNGSELYIAPSDKALSAAQLKITNYHKPSIVLNGYGSGYGGQ